MPPLRLTQSERHGFDHSNRHRVMQQLRDILKLDQNQFIELKQTMARLIARHLDLDKIGRGQVAAIDRVMEDLKSELPVWFGKGDIEQREFFARIAILFLHTRRRKMRPHPVKKKRRKYKKDEHEQDDEGSDTENHSQEHKDPRTPNTAKPGLPLTQRMKENLLSIMNGTPAPKIFASPARRTRNVTSDSPTITRLPLSDIPASASRSQSSQVLPPQTPNSRGSASFLSSHTSQAKTPNKRIPPPSLARHNSSQIDRSRTVKVEKTSFSIPVVSSSNMVPGSSSSTQGSSLAVPSAREGQIRSVHKFLKAAIPSMSHLLRRFVEFGCLGEDFLFAVSTWSPERIRAFLKSLPPGPGGSALTKMEVEILAYHFESYFLVSNSKA